MARVVGRVSSSATTRSRSEPLTTLPRSARSRVSSVARLSRLRGHPPSFPVRDLEGRARFATPLVGLRLADGGGAPSAPARARLRISVGRGEGCPQKNIAEPPPTTNATYTAFAEEGGEQFFGGHPSPRPSRDASRSARLSRDPLDCPVDETGTEVQRGERNALVVPVHALFIGLRHRERQYSVRVYAEPA